MPDPRLSARSRHAQAVRWHGPDSRQAQDTKRDLAVANVTAYVERVIAEAPPLSDAQRGRLAELFRPVRNGGGRDAA
jgi:hypothetical protein